MPDYVVLEQSLRPYNPWYIISINWSPANYFPLSVVGKLNKNTTHPASCNYPTFSALHCSSLWIVTPMVCQLCNFSANGNMGWSSSFLALRNLPSYFKWQIWQRYFNLSNSTSWLRGWSQSRWHPVRITFTVLIILLLHNSSSLSSHPTLCASATASSSVAFQIRCPPGLLRE